MEIHLESGRLESGLSIRDQWLQGMISQVPKSKPPFTFDHNLIGVDFHNHSTNELDATAEQPSKRKTC